jgi:hypothetical protein
MRIGRSTNGVSCEFKMQKDFVAWLVERDLQFIDEIYVSEVSRRPDFLINNGGQLVNVEAKCNDFRCMLNQLKDNSAFCDYSFAFITDVCLTPQWFKKALLESQFGLIVYNFKNGAITEVLEAHQNKNIDRKMKQIVLEKIKKESIKRKPVLDIQQKLF